MVDHPALRHRTFIALDIDLSVREEMAAWLRAARAGRHLRAVRPRNMHLTLAFLGERDGLELAQVSEILDGVDSPAPRLAIGAPLWLPPRRPRVLAVEVHDVDQTLARLQEGIARALSKSLDWRSQGSFRPHITLARISRTSRPNREALPPTPQLEFTAESLSLYRSELRPEGAEYEALRSWDLSPHER